MLEIALIGAGAMGANHARVGMALRDARIAVVVDPDEERGRGVAEAAGARYSPELGRIAGMVDAAIIAVPTPYHPEVAAEALGAGLHVLVEKPIAATPEEGRRMTALAEEAGRVLMVGHVERFNPAVLQLDDIVGDPLHIATERISPRTSRITEGVVRDLMIHDLDLVASLAGAPVASVQAVAVGGAGFEDLASALLTFRNGAVATLTASRLGQDKVREIAVTQKDEYIRADLLRQSVTVHRVEHVGFDGSFGGYRERGVVEIPFLRHRGEPLLLELEEFVRSVTEGSRPRVGGPEGVAALELSELVRAALTSPE